LQTTETDEINNCPHYPFDSYEDVAAEISASAAYMSFDQTLSRATDVVVAEFIARRRFNRYTIELEFAVSDRILGNAPDTIFIYVGISTIHCLYGIIPTQLSTDIHFEAGTNYMLFLRRLTGTQTLQHEDAYQFAGGTIIINLDDPTQSTMKNISLVEYATSHIPLDFASRSTTSDYIASFVSEATKNNQTHYNDIFFPSGTSTEDIVNGSPYVFIIEINRIRTSQPGAGRNLYYFTIIDSLKGEIGIDYTEWTPILNDAVRIGEQFIVAVYRYTYRPEIRPWYRLTSRNSVFEMDRLDEIKTILGLQ